MAIMRPLEVPPPPSCLLRAMTRTRRPDLDYLVIGVDARRQPCLGGLAGLVNTVPARTEFIIIAIIRNPL